MTVMKKAISLMLTLGLLLAGLPSLAETAQDTAGFSGRVAYRETISITAPFGGTVQDYSLRAGDATNVGDSLFNISTTKVYAPCDGTVRGLRAQAGDDAAAVIERYKALLFIEPAGRFTVSANTADAYKSDSNGNENRYLHEGETVYMRCSSDNDRTGVGIITSVDGRNFTVEVTQSTLNMEDSVSIYRDADYTDSQRIASKAKVNKADSISITGEGSLLRCPVSEGDNVKRGDLLFELVKGTMDGLKASSNQVLSPVNGAIVEIKQTAGNAVNQNDVLATVYSQDALWVEVEIDESDLDKVQAGLKVKVQLDALESWDTLEGTVSSISLVSSTDDGDATYTAYVQLNQTKNLRVGMSVSVYLQ
jgi:multidrug resistance efflux pump